MNAGASESPDEDRDLTCETTNSPLVIFDGPWDSTPRPRRPNSPRYFPGREPPPGYPEPPKPPSGEQPPPVNPPPGQA